DDQVLRYDADSGMWLPGDAGSGGGGGTGAGVKVVRTTTQSVGNNSQYVVVWEAEEFDTDNFWSSGTDVVVPNGQEGTYLLVAWVSWASHGSGDRFMLPMVNGSEVDSQRFGPAANSGTRYSHTVVTQLD